MSENLDKVCGIDRIPLFPLPLVMLPNELLPLHIFEDRYREMLRDVEHGANFFGVLLFEPASGSSDRPPVGTVGCVAEIRESELLPDGRSNILTIGIVRFRLLEYAETEKLYLVGDIEFFEDESSNGEDLATLADEVYGLFERVAKAAFSMSGNRGQFPEIQKTDPESLSFLITAAFNFENERKYSLLEMTSTAKRLQELREVLNSTVIKMEESAELLVVARSNGHGKKKINL
jgi:Lon protease-like protein